MTLTHLEKRFYEAFDIEPTLEYKNVPCINFIGDTGICDVSEEVCNPIKCNDYTPDKHSKCWENAIKVYPPITDHVLLELIKLLLSCDIDIYHDCIKAEKFEEDILILAIQQLSIIFPYYKDDVRKIMGVE